MTKLAAKGTTFSWNSVLVTQVRSINHTRSNESADVSDLDSTHKEFVALIPDNGEVSLTLWYDPDEATHATFETDFEAATSRTFIITWADATPATKTGTAFITAYEELGAVDGVMEANITIKVTGAITTA